ncbi:phospholipid scramblase-related protein [Streptomyces noursei]|uniref:phospholipid scramblase-related protein n=1 Tax=Streptomyces noursei TaxID=1971 RepID=UPI0023B863DD|nr:phospholipid scramblase-related protein [Streptomyces noursei]
MTEHPAVPQGWYQDPSGAAVLRWWDGARWTEHTQAAPPQVPAPAPAPAPAQQQYAPQAPAQQQPYPPQAPQPPAQQHPYPPQAQQAPVQQQFPPGGGGPEALLSADVLAVNQNFKWVDISTSYSVLDRKGIEVGSVAETGQNAARKVMRFVSTMDRYLSRKFEIRDAAGVPFLELSRGTKVLKAKVQVARPDGTPVGEILQDRVVTFGSFDLVVGGATIGHIQASWSAFNFTITDHTGTEVARIGRSLLDRVLDVAFGADYYYYEVLSPMAEPLRSMSLAAALTMDTLLKPDKDGDA